MEIHLIRHTTPDVEKNICYGQSNVLLKDTFQDEYKLVLESLPYNADVIYTSPLTRCTQLAEEIAQALRLPVKKDDRLKEMNFGAWEMQRWDDVDQDALMKWMNNYQHERCPQGESYFDLMKRLEDFLEEIRMEKSQSIIIVTHAGVIKTCNAILNSVPFNDSMALKVEYGSLLTMKILI